MLKVFKAENSFETKKSPSSLSKVILPVSLYLFSFAGIATTEYQIANQRNIYKQRFPTEEKILKFQVPNSPLKINQNLKKNLERLGYLGEFAQKITDLEAKYGLKVEFPENNDNLNAVNFQAQSLNLSTFNIEQINVFIKKVELNLIICSFLTYDFNSASIVSNVQVIQFFDRFDKVVLSSGFQKSVAYYDGKNKTMASSTDGDAIHAGHEALHGAINHTSESLAKAVSAFLHKNKIKTSKYGGDPYVRPLEVVPEIANYALVENGLSGEFKRNALSGIIASLNGFEFYSDAKMVDILEDIYILRNLYKSDKDFIYKADKFDKMIIEIRQKMSNYKTELAAKIPQAKNPEAENFRKQISGKVYDENLLQIANKVFYNLFWISFGVSVTMAGIAFYSTYQDWKSED